MLYSVVVGQAAKELHWPTVPPSISGGGEGGRERTEKSLRWRAGRASELYINWNDNSISAAL